MTGSELEHHLRSILAVIFRDGGQRAATYPTLAEAVAAAHEEWAALLARMERMRADLAALRDDCKTPSWIRIMAEAALADQPGEKR